jgi:hypothetical protein
VKQGFFCGFLSWAISASRHQPPKSLFINTVHRTITLRSRARKRQVYQRQLLGRQRQTTRASSKSFGPSYGLIPTSFPFWSCQRSLTQMILNPSRPRGMVDLFVVALRRFAAGVSPSLEEVPCPLLGNGVTRSVHAHR